MMKKLKTKWYLLQEEHLPVKQLKEDTIVLIAEFPNSKHEEMLRVLTTLGGKSLFCSFRGFRCRKCETIY